MPITSSNTVTFDGSYELMHFTDQKAIVPLVPGSQIKATFANGQLSGNGGINRYDGSYSVSKDMPPSTISGVEFTSTKMAGDPEVMAQEQRYFDGLRAAKDIVYGDGTVSLTWDNGQKSLVFRRV
jgi:heat shock protein HslJ